MKFRLISFLLLMAYALLIAWLSLKPAEPGPPLWFAQEDKLFHLMAYSAFVVLAAPFLQKLRFALPVVLLIWVYAGMMEIIQYWIPGRDSSWQDMLANTLGVLLGYTLVKSYVQKRLQLLIKTGQ